MELGFDPNYKINSYTFIEQAILYHLNINYILRITELALQYGYDLNKSYILKTIDESPYYHYEDSSALYIFMEQNGYDKEINCKKTRNVAFKKQFKELAEKSNINLDARILEDISFVDEILEIINCFNFSNGLSSDYEFIEQTIMQIQEERGNNINFVNNPVSKVEIIRNLKTLILKYTAKKFDKFLIKKEK